MPPIVSRRAMLAAGVAGVAMAPKAGEAQTPPSSPGNDVAIKHYIMIDLLPGTDMNVLDRWYMRFHAPEVRRMSRAWQRNYLSYRAYDVPPDADVYPIWRGRLTEIHFDSLDDFRESRVNSMYGFDTMTAPPGGWGGAGWRTETATLPINPQQVFLAGRAPPKETPYLRWIVFARAPAGVEAAAFDRWLAEVHVPELARLPGLRRFVGYRSVATDPDYPTVMELWFDDYPAWRQAMLTAAPIWTAPPWAGQPPFMDMVSTFIGENPDIDFINDRRVIP